MPQTEKRKELTKQIVIRVKEVIQDMTDAEVMQRMAEAGEQTSIATIRRIRASGSEDAGFNYNLTVKPFARVFLELSSKPVAVEALSSDEEKDRASLENIIQIKELQIESLETQLKAATTQLGEVKTDAQQKILHLQQQIKALQAVLDDRKEFMDQRRDFIFRLEAEKAALRRTVAILAIVVAVLALVIFAALIIDRSNGDVGFFWLEQAAAQIFGSHAGATAQISAQTLL